MGGKQQTAWTQEVGWGVPGGNQGWRREQSPGHKVVHPESCEELSEFVSVDGCAQSRILRYMENKYPERTTNWGRWVFLAVMTIIQRKKEHEGSGHSGDTGSSTCGGMRRKAGPHD